MFHLLSWPSLPVIEDWEASYSSFFIIKSFAYQKKKKKIKHSVQHVTSLKLITTKMINYLILNTSPRRSLQNNSVLSFWGQETNKLEKKSIKVNMKPVIIGLYLEPKKLLWGCSQPDSYPWKGQGAKRSSSSAGRWLGRCVSSAVPGPDLAWEWLGWLWPIDCASNKTFHYDWCFRGLFSRK